jgi:murein DD-endopeptidase MepM/ murein hydrolase activator NlpD
VTGRGWLGLLIALVFLAGGGIVWYRAEGTPPSVTGPDELLLGSSGATVTIDLIDERSGLREVEVAVREAGDSGEATILLQRSFPGAVTTGGEPNRPEQVEVTLDPKALNLTDGEATLVVTVRDWSWRNGLLGNEAVFETALEVDLRKPRVQVDTGLTYVERGGAGAVTYTLGEPTTRDGVQVADVFFRGYPAPGTNGDTAATRRVALYAVPTDAPPNPKIEVIAEDRAGNLGRAAWPVVVKERVLPVANITLPKRFLDVKTRNLADAENIPYDDAEPARAFDQINTELRARNEELIRSITAKSASEPSFTGAFGQLSNSKVTSRFAEQRSYFVDGKKVSQATHFGYDLASTAGAPIEASGTGRVVYADSLGIYGNCVILDHGLGLFTLYAHLSRIDVAVDDLVEKDQSLGSSGSTGLAGGDHLHFAVILSNTYVDPIEWWDPFWVKTHIEARIAAPTAAEPAADAP